MDMTAKVWVEDGCWIVYPMGPVEVEETPTMSTPVKETKRKNKIVE
jgi:hypothetical protein